MTVALPYPVLVDRMERLLFAIQPVLPHRCETCGKRCSGGVHAPGQRKGPPGAEYYEPGPWECESCSRKSWGPHLKRVARRRMLIALGPSHPEARGARWVQCELFGGGE